MYTIYFEPYKYNGICTLSHTIRQAVWKEQGNSKELSLEKSEECDVYYEKDSKGMMRWSNVHVSDLRSRGYGFENHLMRDTFSRRRRGPFAP